MTGYTKLFSTLIGSTIWREPDHVRLVWITMLALRNRNHVVEASVPGLADFAKVSVEKCRQALKVLSSPDPDSRSKEHDGRRIEEVEGGWLILNGEKYRQKMNQDERREANKLYQRKFRERQKLLKSGTPLAGELAHKRAFEAGEVDEDGQPVRPRPDRKPNPPRPTGEDGPL